MANTVNQWGNPKAKEIYDKYMSWDNKDKLYIPETPSFKEKYPDKTMDEYLNSLNPEGRNAAISLNQDRISLDSLNWNNSTTNWVETVGSTITQNAPTSNTNDWTITVWPQNANLNYYQYWDDSNPAQQKQAWWMNEKYTWEWVKTSNLDYDPNITRADLDPNYLFWENARQQNRQEAGYIARRNDMIASALYNEWLTSKDDVANFLSQQNEWMNSTEADRMNTIESVWKRLWQIKPEQIEEKPKDSTSPDVIYGKVWTEEDWTVIANIDRNAILNQIDSAKIANANALLAMQPKVAAAATYWWQTPYGSQALRDVQLNNPEWYNQYQQELKKLYTQDEINNISHWSAETWSWIVESTDLNINNDEKTWQEQNINNDNAEYANSTYREKLNNNKTATSAKEQMSQIKLDIVDLQDKIDWLKAKANNIFPADTPDYIVQWYIANNTQELNKKIQNLENKFLSLSDIYKTEVWNIQRAMEYQLKVDAANREAFNDERERYYKEAQLENDLVQWSKDANWNLVWFKYDPKTNTMRQVTDWEAYDSYNNAVSKVSAKAKSYVWKSTWKQCLWFTNMLTKETAWVTMQSADWWEVLARDRIAYATDPNVSDYIPVVWDVAVWVWWPYNSYYWHTMYVDNVWTDASWEVWFHYIATNDWKHEDKTIAYEWSKRVKDFYANWWVWFWNPFKQAQYNNRTTISSTDNSIYLDPMEPVVDDLVKNGKLTVSQLDSIYKFWNSYQKLYRANDRWYITSLLESWEVSWFLRTVDLNWKNIDKVRSLWWDVVKELVSQLESAAAKKFSWDAYNAYIAIIWVLENKLREESWARINQNEWNQDFMQYLPEASDNLDRKKEKLTLLENWLRWFAKKWGITAKEYVPIFNFDNESSEGKKISKRTSRIYK